MKKKTVNINIGITFFLLIAFTLLFEFRDFDNFLQNFLYDSETQQWLINEDDPIKHFIFYSGIKALYYLIYILTLLSMIFCRKSLFIKEHKKGLIILLLSLTIIPIVIGTLKRFSHIPCPNQLTIYGGHYIYAKLFSLHHYHAACYPAGHASGGFSFMALFFVFNRPLYKYIGLATAIFLGWSTGFYKMAVGDHFTSHTMTTMLLAWLFILLFVKILKHYSSYKKISSTLDGS